MGRPSRIYIGPLAAAIFAFAGLSLGAPDAVQAGKKGDKYFFSLAGVVLKEKIPAELEAQVRAQAAASIEAHKRIITALPAGAPDPATSPKRYKKYLKRKKLRAFKVHIEVTSYVKELEPNPPPRPGQRLKVSIELRMFGETIPDRVIAFSGDGSATVILEIGKKVRDRDAEVANKDALELAVAKALARSIEKLSAPPPATKKKRKKRAKK